MQSDTSTPPESPDKCPCDDSEFPCWSCFRNGRRDLDGNHLATDGGRRRVVAKDMKDCDRHASWREVYRLCGVDPDAHDDGGEG